MRGRAQTYAALAAIALVAALGGVGAGPASAAELEPARGALLGLYYGSGGVEKTNRAIGAKPDIHLTYFAWKDPWATTRSTRSDLENGRIPLVVWEPFDADFDDIVAGRYDALIRRRADQARELGEPFFLDFAAEMNASQNWSGHDPAKYVAAWRHIHDIFDARGADNVVWVWAPNNVDSPNSPPALRYYPGDAYVDWAGIDGYNWGTSKPGFRWQSFSDVFRPMYTKLARLGKPIMIGETASDEVGGSKARWIDNIPRVLRGRFPMIKAVTWFDVRKERQWQIRSSLSSLRAFRRLADRPLFKRSSGR